MKFSKNEINVRTKIKQNELAECGGFLACFPTVASCSLVSLQWRVTVFRQTS